MSDTSQGEGWWIASDGKWYPPESATHLPPPPPIVGPQSLPPNPAAPAMSPPVAAVDLPANDAPATAAAPTPKRPIYKRPAIMIPIAVVLLIGIIAAIAAGGSKKKPNNASAITSSTVITTTTTDPTAAASSAFVTAFNTLSTAVNAGIAQQNSGDPATETTGINAEIAAEQAFDSTLSGITFPSSAQSDAQKVLSDDASVENLQGTLALNTSDVANYNQIFDTVIPAQSTDTAALSALAADLGDTISTTTPTT